MEEDLLQGPLLKSLLEELPPQKESIFIRHPENCMTKAVRHSVNVASLRPPCREGPRGVNAAISPLSVPRDTIFPIQTQERVEMVRQEDVQPPWALLIKEAGGVVEQGRWIFATKTSGRPCSWLHYSLL